MKADILNTLDQLFEAQTQMLSVLNKKQAVLVRPEKDAMALIAAEEEKSLEEMQIILKRREDILETARLQNIRGESIEQLCGHFFPHNTDVQKLLDETKHRTQQIRLLAYTNWVLSRKALIHVSQILELLDTSGLGKTTYQPRQQAGGKRVNRVA